MEAKAPSAPPPLFAQVESALRERILDNKLVAGDKLPSESELEREFGVSRITVRQALSSLHASGFIQKINGKGSFVTRPNELPRLGGLTGFYEHMRAQGREAHGRTLSVRQVAASAQIAEALGVSPGTPLTAVAILRLVDGKPLAVGTTYGPPSLIKALVDEDAEANDMMTMLEGRLGFRLRSTHIEASAVRAGKARGRQLDVPESAPLLRIRFTPHDVSDQPLCYSEMYFRADQFSYKAVIKR
ncbi:GntR family transcriptional regulator [Variovorax sp. Sphag1AA]|uniref:GntR family transcriptional regulator n=1 Tax=Variovorax sp. Sphag1AA TaxID=2587027 RepID=UPI00160C5553|nr:GntR family transcriptional regulator [Variovorax sp. Sphag1AA]MBB3181427.1 GntR family transcriptional regulator [Variovorax sp. Sphag1AA]